MAPPPAYTEKDEAQIRIEIDRKLEQAGWVVRDKKKLNLHTGVGIAVWGMDRLKQSVLQSAFSGKLEGI